MSKILATGNFCTVQPLDDQREETGSGLVLSKTQNKMIMKGIVLSLGTGKKLALHNLAIGDTIFFQDFERDKWYDKDTPKGMYFVKEDIIYGKIDHTIGELIK